MRTRLTLAAGLAVGFLLGSKAGPKPYEAFQSGMRWLRGTRVVSVPIEATAHNVSELVRAQGEKMTDRAANSVYQRIAGVGQGPLVVEARVTELEEV